MMTPPHLGGHLNKTHTDSGAISFLRTELGIQSVLDVGCGKGGMEEVCQVFGVGWTGVDGDPACFREGVIRHDFTKGFPKNLPEFDLTWSVEFVEHVHEQFLANLLLTFGQARKAICMTHAMPGKPGHHHVNCQLPEYWVDKMKLVGFELSPALTQGVREASSMGREFMRSTGMVFTRK